MRTPRLLLALLGGLLAAGSWLPAAPYGPDGLAVTDRQPDGQVIELRLFGDEFSAHLETPAGYVVVFDPARQAYCYAAAAADGGAFVSTGLVVGQTEPARQGLARGLRLAPDVRARQARARRERLWPGDPLARRWAERQRAAAAAGAARSWPPPLAGPRVGLTLLVEFADADTNPAARGTVPPAAIDDLCNGRGRGATAVSVYDYFRRESDGRLEYCNVVTAYVRLARPKAAYDDPNQDCARCGQQVVREALALLMDQGWDFGACTTAPDTGQLDAVNCFYAGTRPAPRFWGKGLWPHAAALVPPEPLGAGHSAGAYQLTDLGGTPRIGTFCHETGHLLLGYPDLYDYGYESAGAGRYTLMAFGDAGPRPVHVGGYLKLLSGWAEVVDLDAASQLRAAVRVDGGALYRYANPLRPAEFFLIETRQRRGWERGTLLPADGLLIAHADQDVYGNDDEDMTAARHYELSIEQADGHFKLEGSARHYGGAGDLFAAPRWDTFTDGTKPNAHWWTGADGSPTSGLASGLIVRDVGAAGHDVMTFSVGAATTDAPARLGSDVTGLRPDADLGTDAPPATVALWNQGGGSLTYTVSADVGWLAVTPAAGTLAAAPACLTVTYATSALAAGTYAGTLVIAGGPAPCQVRVELTVRAPATLVVTPGALSQTVMVGRAATAMALQVANVAADGQFASTLRYALAADVPWLDLGATAGTVIGEVDTIRVTLDTTGLTPGDYAGTIAVSAPGAVASPQAIPVRLTVAPTGPADLSLDLTVDDRQPAVGATVTFTVTVANAGPQAATNVGVSVPLPAELTGSAAQPSQGRHSLRTGQWTLGTLPPGGSASLQLTATVTTPAPLPVTAQVAAADQEDPDSTPGNGVPTEDDQATVVVDADAPPVGRDDAGLGFTTTEDAAFTTASVLANDGEATLDHLTVIAFDTTGTRGQVTSNGDGTFHYSPNGQFESLRRGAWSEDGFQYTMGHAHGTATAIVTIAVAGVNDPPVTQDDAYTTDEDTVLVVPAPGVLANDRDPDTDDGFGVPDGHLLSDAGASVTLRVNGGFTYDPTVSSVLQALAPGQTATDRFRYHATDGLAAVPATVTVTVAGVNDPPVAVASATPNPAPPGAMIELSGVGSFDPDAAPAAPLTWRWEWLAGPDHPALDTPEAATAHFATAMQGAYVFRLTVSDALGAGTATVEVIVGNTLTIVAPTTGREGDGPLPATLVLSRRLAAAETLTVSLGVDDASEVAVPPTVTVTGGQDRATFTVSVIDDAERDGERTVRLTATATAWVPATATLAIADNERQQLVGLRVATGGGCALAGTAGGAPPADLSAWLVLALCAAAGAAGRRRRPATRALAGPSAGEPHRPPAGDPKSQRTAFLRAGREIGPGPA